MRKKMTADEWKRYVDARILIQAGAEKQRKLIFDRKASQRKKRKF